MNVLLNKIVKTDNKVELPNAKKLKEGDLIPIVSDTMFKVILGNESRKKLTAYFLSLVLNKDRNKIEENMKFVKNELDQDKFFDAKKSVDIIIELDGKMFNIEMNNRKSISALERNIDYANKLYVSSRKRSSDYKYEYVFQININNFYFEGENQTMDEYGLISTNNKDKVLTDKIHFIYFYLPKMLEKYYNKDELTDIEKLLIILSANRVEDYSDIREENEIMKEAYKTLCDSSTDDEIIGLYDKEEEDEWLRNAEKREAREEARKETQIEAAISFMKIATPLKDISKALDIDVKKLEKLREENNIPNYDEIKNKN